MFNWLSRLVQRWFKKPPPAPPRPLHLEGLENRRLLSGVPALLPPTPLPAVSAVLQVATTSDLTPAVGLEAGVNLGPVGGGSLSVQANPQVSLRDGPGLNSTASLSTTLGSGPGLNLGAAVNLSSLADPALGLHLNILGSQVDSFLGVSLGSLGAPTVGLTESLQVELSGSESPILEGGTQVRLNGDAPTGGSSPSLAAEGDADLRLASLVDLVFSRTGSTSLIPNSWENAVPESRISSDASQRLAAPPEGTIFPGPAGDEGPTRLANVEAVTDVLFSTALLESIGGHPGDEVLLAMSSPLAVEAQAALPPAPESPRPAPEAAGEPAGEETGEAGVGEAAPQADDSLANAAFDADSLEKALARFLGQLGDLGHQWCGVLAGLEPYAWFMVVLVAALLVVRSRRRTGPSPGNPGEAAFAGFSGLAGLAAGEAP